MRVFFFFFKACKLTFMNLDLSVQKSSQGAQRDGKELEIYTAGLEFESGRAPLVKAWDNRDFTRSPGLTKYTFREVEFPRI